MRTNHSGVTEVAHIRTDKEKFDVNYLHIFEKDKCPCNECVEFRRLVTENAMIKDYAIKDIQSK